MKEQESLKWALSQLEVLQKEKTYGSVVFYLENGIITRSKRERIDMPPKVS